ncbi:surface lipoprotein assembly modifier [Aliiroseovarius sp. KMU-50]|uniref:Surface lipoprotein assembly modifier n=1 Tax=Aliiroseovarius salicola TaxID=3009082 RepID=A0ABT4W180_9RHOB|nr:surface lipoprotein assembly modifier [Aliiroseovarius sp. KMU-50]MDA5094260.1 surface lipoprotein assembly modifier [Aliiroseovarius sp. KMU-50]
MRILNYCISAIFLGLMPASVHAEALTLSKTGMVEATRLALQARNPELALALAEAVLEVTPNRVDMLVLKSRALRDLGRYGDALDTAKQAWTFAENDLQKFAAALVAAQAQSSRGNKTAGQFWLRRAANHAETDAQKLQLRRDFRYLKDRNPWNIRLDFGLSPNSNVNNGSSEDTITLFGLPFSLSPTAQALSGLQGNVSIDLSYRFRETQRSRTFLGFQAYHRESWLSSSAQDAAPSASNSDFRYSSAALTFKHQQLFPKARLDLSARFGRNWYATEVLSDFVSLGTELLLPREHNRQLMLLGRVDHQSHAAPSRADLTVARVGMRYRIPQDGRTWTLSADAQQSFSDNLSQEYKEISAGVDVSLGQIFKGANLSLGLSAAHRQYDISPYSVDGRTDTTIEAHSDVILSEITYFGFAPVVTLRHSDTRSNITLYSKRETSVGLSLTSQF